MYKKIMFILLTLLFMSGSCNLGGKESSISSRKKTSANIKSIKLVDKDNFKSLLLKIKTPNKQSMVQIKSVSIRSTIAELDEQINELYEKRDDLYNQRIELYEKQYDELSNKRRELENQRRELENQRNDLENQYNKFIKESNELVNKRKELDRPSAELDKQINELENQIKDIEDKQIKELYEKRDEVDKQIKEVDKPINGLNKKLDDLFKKRYADLYKRINELEDKYRAELDKQRNKSYNPPYPNNELDKKSIELMPLFTTYIIETEDINDKDNKFTIVADYENLKKIYDGLSNDKNDPDLKPQLKINGRVVEFDKGFSKDTEDSFFKSKNYLGDALFIVFENDYKPAMKYFLGDVLGINGIENFKKYLP